MEEAIGILGFDPTPFWGGYFAGMEEALEEHGWVVLNAEDGEIFYAGQGANQMWSLSIDRYAKGNWLLIVVYQWKDSKFYTQGAALMSGDTQYKWE